VTELIVRLPYRNKAREISLTLLKITFPLWGVFAPLVAAILLFPIFGYLLHPWPQAHFNSLVGTCSTLILTAFLGLVTTNWLSRDALRFDRHGVELPFSLIRSKRSIPWNEILALQLAHADHEHWRDNALEIIDRARVKVRLPLEFFEPEQIEQMLLALEVWGKDISVGEEVLSLKSSLYGIDSPSLSFTGMWQEELARRFCPTGFIPLEPGTALRNGTLTVLRHLALGGLSAVYLCQMDNRRLVVLKEAVVSADASESAHSAARAMLDREANMLLKLDNPAVVKVLDHFIDQGRDYLMLEYINGQDLRQLVNQNGPQSEANVVDWALQMVAILKSLHDLDPAIIHRDFTPDNLVLRNDGSIVLIDFGTANEFIGTATGTFVGKHAFIAPEQFRGKAVIQSDIYALGCTLFFLLTAKEPEALSTSNPVTHNDRISKELCDLIETCTQLEVPDRFQSVTQMVPILRSLVH